MERILTIKTYQYNIPRQITHRKLFPSNMILMIIWREEVYIIAVQLIGYMLTFLIQMFNMLLPVSLFGIRFFNTSIYLKHIYVYDKDNTLPRMRKSL